VRPRQRVFGVVLSLPRPLSRVADRVRRNYDPNFPFIGPHVTVLPPRPLPLNRREVLEAVRRVAERTAPISLTLGKVETFFPVMPVVFLGFRKGLEELRRLHRNLARAPLSAVEAFPFVPHLTLGQDLDASRLRQVVARSRELFAAKSISRSWPAECLVVVERCSSRRWIALKPLLLSGPPRRKSRAHGRRRRV